MIKKLYRFLHPKIQTLFLDYPVEFKPRYGHGLAPHPELHAIVNEHRNEYKELLTKAISYSNRFAEINDQQQEKDTTKPTWNNGFLPGLDVVGIYTMLAEYKPSTYVEIGSGNSTKVAYKAKQDQQLNTKIVSIDPMPRAEIDALTDELIRKPFENIDFSFLYDLKENDILFVDNSHRILPNSDSMVFYMEILPRLKKGVIVHIHDIYIPYDYPQFMCDRFYSEQYGLAIYLLANPIKYKTLLPNYFISEDKELSSHIESIWEKASTKNIERHGGSYWIQINA
jgi:hypothetical protein